MKARRKPAVPPEQLRLQAESLLARTPREIAQMPGPDVQTLVQELQVHQIELEMQNDQLRRTQQQLERARDRYIELYDFSPVAYLTLNANGEILEANLLAGELFGLDRARLIHQKFTRFIPAGAQDAFYLLFRQVFNTDTPQRVNLELVDAMARRRVVQLDAARSEASSRKQCRLSLSDITQVKESERALRESEERLQAIMDNSPMLIFLKDLQGRYLHLNRKTAELLHLPREQSLGKTDAELLPLAQAARFQAGDRKVLAARSPLDFEETYELDGGPRTYNVTKFPLQDAEGHIYGVGGIAVDVTERERTLERIAQLNRVLAVNAGVDQAIIHSRDQKTLLNGICRAAVKRGGFKLVWVGLTSPDGAVRPVAQAGVAGYLKDIRIVTQDEPEGRGPVGVAIRENRPVVVEDIAKDASMAPWRERARRYGLRYVAAFPLRRSGQVVGAFQVYAPRGDFFDKNEVALLTQVGEEISFALTALSDPAARQQAEQALRRSELNLTEFFNRAPIGLEWLSASGQILRANRAQMDLLGYPPEQYLGRCFSDFCTDPVGTRHLLERLAAREAVNNLRLPRRRQDGTVRLMLVDAQSVWHGGKFLYSSVFSRDITDRVHLEQEILEISEREHRRIAEDLHDGLGQVLVGTAFLGNTLRQRLAAKSLPEARQADRLLEALDEAIGQTRSLARGLYPVRPLPNALMAALSALASRTRDFFRVRCRFFCRQPVLIEDNTVATHLYRIAQEAVTNAIKHGKASRIEISLTQTPGRVRIAVNDNGVGLPARPSKKPGMGLRIMRYRAGAIGGSLVFQKPPGGGTTIVCTVHQPADSSLHEGQRATQGKEHYGGTQTEGVPSRNEEDHPDRG